MVQLLNDVIFAEVRIFGLLPERITDHPHQIAEISAFKPHRPRLTLRQREADMQKHTNDKQPGKEFVETQPRDWRYEHRARCVKRETRGPECGHQEKCATPMIKTGTYFVALHTTFPPRHRSIRNNRQAECSPHEVEGSY